MAWIYILHFDNRLSHAEHYVGTTEHLKERLTAHAQGKGATLTRHVEHWTLGTLATCSRANARRVERNLKRAKNTPSYCAFCTNSPLAITGARAYPIEQLRFPTAAHLLRTATQKADKAQWYIRSATHEDLEWIKGAAGKEKQLGFIPISDERTGLAALIPDRLHVAISETFRGFFSHTIGTPIGFVAHTRNTTTRRATIHQIYVDDQDRHRGVGRAMVNLVRVLNAPSPTIAHVRADIPEIYFWQAVNAEQVRTKMHRTSHSTITTFQFPPYLEEKKPCNENTTSQADEATSSMTDSLPY